MDLFERLRSLPRLPRAGFRIDDGAETPARRWESKVGGAPYLPRGAAYPTTPDGRPMAFIAQVNLGDLEAWRRDAGAPVVLDGRLPTEGLLQLYLPWGEGWGWRQDSPDRMNDCSIYYCGGIVADDAALAEPLVALTDGETGELRLAREATAVDRGPSGRVLLRNGGGEEVPLRQPGFGFPMAPVRPDPEWQIPHPDHVEAPADVTDAVDDFRRKNRLDTSLHHLLEAEYGRGGVQLGGRPLFTQDDPRSEDDWELLFQLDGASSGVLSIGDMGVMTFFLPRGDLARGDLSRARMYWDCG